MKARLRKRSGAIYTSLNSPAASRRMRDCCSANGRLLLIKVAAIPRRREGIHLVFHQGDQRADDHRYPIEHQRGELVTKRFAAASGHDNQGVAAAQDGRDHLLLRIQELAKAEMFF